MSRPTDQITPQAAAPRVTTIVTMTAMYGAHAVAISLRVAVSLIIVRAEDVAAVLA